MASPVEVPAEGRSIPFCPLEPTEHQWRFATNRQRNIRYVSGRGGGKTVAALMAVLSGADQYGYRALIIGDNYHTFETLLSWVAGVEGVKVNKQEQLITFPNGGVVLFSMNDGSIPTRHRAQEYNTISVDTCDPLDEGTSNFLRTRMRLGRPRMREAFNVNLNGSTELWGSDDR